MKLARDGIQLSFEIAGQDRLSSCSSMVSVEIARILRPR
jgi:hypothetical protein